MAKASEQVAAKVQAWRERGDILRLKGQDIFVVDEGGAEHPVLLLIHGFPTSSYDWEPMWSTLSQHFRVIALDMLGFGFSDKPKERSYTIHGQADFVEALLREKSVGEFHMLAHDYGDTVGQEILARQNEGKGAGKLLSACFLNGGLFPETHHALLTQKLLLSPLGRFVNALAGYGRFKKNFSSVFGPETKPTEDELQAFWAIINTHEGKHVFHNCITYMHDRLKHRERWVKALQEPLCTLALINGSVDPVSGAHMVARYKELNCQLDYLAELPAIGHYPQVEDPVAVAQHYLQFVDSCCELGGLTNGS